MPVTQIVLFQDTKGKVPVLDWLRRIAKSDRKGYANCLARIEQLAEYGFELRRPAADFLRDRVQYRILYFFHGQNVVILAHAIIDLALTYKELFILNSDIHTYIQPEDETDEQNE